MRKSMILFSLLLCVPSFAATWFADSTGNANSITWHAANGNASCTTGTGATLSWPPAAGDILDAHYCTVTFVSAGGDPGINGLITLTNSGSAGSFSCVTSAGPASLTVNVTGAANGAGMLLITGSSGTACQLSGNGTLTGGTASGCHAVNDTHTVTSLTHAVGLCQGGTTSSSTAGYQFNSASGTVTLSCNARAGTAGPGVTVASGTGGNMTLNGNCVGSDTASSQSAACVAGNGSSSSSLTITKDLIEGKYGSAISNTGKYFIVPGSATQAHYHAANSTYQATDIADSSNKYATKAANAITYTNVTIAPFAYATNGIGTGCSSVDGTGCSNIKTGISAGPLNGSLASGAANSGSAQ